MNWYPWVVALHVFGSFTFVFAHGASAFVALALAALDVGVTLEAAATILLVIKHVNSQLKRDTGIKISGGIREVQQAAQYVELADRIMGKEWVTVDTFRIGASKLADELGKIS